MYLKASLPLEAANAQPLRAFVVQIKSGSLVRCKFEAMGADSLSVAQQHEGLCVDREYVSVRPLAFGDAR